MAQDKFTVMTTTPVQKLIGRLALPTIVSMLVTSFYNMADTYFVSKLGTSASAAVGVVFSLMAIIQALGFFFGHGSGNFISRKMGAGDMREAETMASTGFFSAFIAGIVLAVFGFCFTVPLAKLLGSTETILPYAVDYMRYILIGAPWMMASLVLNNQLRFQGSAVYGMVGIASGAVINIALDPLLIFTFDMGIAGAALATIISQFVGFILLIIGTRKGGNLAVRFSRFKPSLYYYKNIINGGAPSLLRQGLNSVGTICLNFGAGAYGDAAIAAMSIVTRIIGLAFSAVIGFGQGFQPVCGFNYGAKKYNRVKEAFWYCVKICTAFLIVMSVIGVILAPNVVALFRKDDAEVIRIGTAAMRWQCVTFFMSAWITMCNMMMQTIGKSVRASIMAMAKNGICFIPVVMLFPRLFGLTGLLISQPTADILSVLLSIPLVKSILLEMKEPETPKTV